MDFARSRACWDRSQLTRLTEAKDVDWEQVGNKASLVEWHKIVGDLSCQVGEFGLYAEVNRV